ncbi:MAG: hypothetical protein LBG44_00970, partial [Gemmatimonadota bacterium]|nr:hypothetical protein [Gemmatimonadota bacterium]
MRRLPVRRISVLASVLAAVFVLTNLLHPDLLSGQDRSLRVSTASPTASSLGRFADVPVDGYTGLADIQVPLMTVKGLSLELPIGLRYHSGGVRVEEIGGWAGIGWALEAGGVITRTLRGIPDEWTNGYYNTGQFLFSSNAFSSERAMVQSILMGQVDSEPDRFFFSFLGRTGEIVMGPTGPGAGTQRVRTIPHQPLRVVPAMSGGALTSWTITDEVGTVYTFSAREVTYPDDSYGEDVPNPYTSSWYLTQIQSADGDVITLHYSAPYQAWHQVVDTFVSYVTGSLSCPPVTDLKLRARNRIDEVRLDSIRSETRTVRFTAGLRQDALSAVGGGMQEYRLERITERTRSGVELGRFDFGYSYSPRLRLESVTESDGNGVSLPPWKFTYQAGMLPGTGSYSQDHWGYYNGKSNSTLLPETTVMLGLNWIILPGANREPDVTATKSGVLTRIDYPTGGSDTFEYEGNDYQSNTAGNTPSAPMVPQTNWLEAGHTQATMTFTVPATQPQRSIPAKVEINLSPWYEDCVGEIDYCVVVQVGGPSGGRTIMRPGTFTMDLKTGDTYTIKIQTWHLNVTGEVRMHWAPVVNNAPNPAGGLRISRIVSASGTGSSSVRRYQYRMQADPTQSSGVIVAAPQYDLSHTSTFSGGCSYFSRTSMSRMPLGDGPVVGYREVTVLQGQNGEYGKTRYTYRTAVDIPDSGINYDRPFAPRTSNAWARGQPVSEVEYNAAGQMQRSTVTTWLPRGLASDSVRYFPALSVFRHPSSEYILDYQIHSYEVVSSWMSPVKDSTFVADASSGGGVIYTVTTREYANPVHQQPTLITEREEYNEVLRETYLRYPNDYATGSGNAEAVAITAMAGPAHMPGVVIERWVREYTSGSGRVLSGELTTYRQFGFKYLPWQRQSLNDASYLLKDFVPSAVTGGSFTRDSRYRAVETVNSYDGSGRVTQLVDARGKIINFAYDLANHPLPTKITRVKDSTGAVDLVTSYVYDTRGNLITMAEQSDTLRRYTYDSFGRLKRELSGTGQPLHGYGYEYSRTQSNGWVYQAGSPNVVTDTTFLTSGQWVVNREYRDGRGGLIQTASGSGTTWVARALEYDAAGRPWRVWNPYLRASGAYDAGFSTNATAWYTGQGFSNPKPYEETHYLADPSGRPRAVLGAFAGSSAPDSVRFAYGTDPGTWLTYVEQTDELGRKTKQYNDLLGNAVFMSRGVGTTEASTTVFAMDVLGRRRYFFDPRGLSTAYLWDTRGRQVKRISPDAGTSETKYDNAGNVRFTRDARQTAAAMTSFFTYDFANRPLVSGEGYATWTSLDPDATVAVTLESTQANWRMVHAYDARPANVYPWSLFWAQISPLTLQHVQGRTSAVASRSAGAWQVELFSYDAQGQVATRYLFTQNNAGTAVLTGINTTVEYTRDARGEITQRALTVMGSTFRQWYDYDARGLLWKVFSGWTPGKPTAPDVIYTYQPDGAVASRQFSGGAVVPYRYTIRNQLAQIGDPSGTVYPFSARYQYHANGTLAESEFYNGGVGGQKHYRYSFAVTNYDAQNRLKGADFSYWNGSTWASTLAFDVTGVTYDAAGNLLSLKRYDDTGVLVDNLGFTLQTGTHRLIQVTEAVGPTPGNSRDAEGGPLTWDLNGNLLTAPDRPGITAAWYDERNLPLSFTRLGVTYSYRYDANGQRILRPELSDPGQHEFTIREGSTALALVSVNGNMGSTNGWTPNLVAGDQVVGQAYVVNTSYREYYHTDRLGSVPVVTNEQNV